MAKCKFYKEIQYYSDDNGSSWFPSGLVRKGGLIESGSTDCDEPTPPTPPTPIDGKYLFTYSDSSTRSGACDTSSAITSGNTWGQDKPYSAMTDAVIGGCVKTIEDGVFSECTSLSSITIPSGVTTIGMFAFDHCTSLSSMTIPSTVTSIGNYAFSRCTSLDSITCLALTPPSSNGDMLFDGTLIQAIYVPSNKVSTYKFAYPWRFYAGIIQAIPNS